MGGLAAHAGRTVSSGAVLMLSTMVDRRDPPFGCVVSSAHPTMDTPKQPFEGVVNVAPGVNIKTMNT